MTDIKARELIERDTEKPMAKFEYQSLDTGEEWRLDICPKCDKILFYSSIKGANFCLYCGQRIDFTNYEL